MCEHGRTPWRLLVKSRKGELKFTSDIFLSFHLGIRHQTQRSMLTGWNQRAYHFNLYIINYYLMDIGQLFLSLEVIIL